jgi:hypothetical protein
MGTLLFKKHWNLSGNKMWGESGLVEIDPTALSTSYKRVYSPLNPEVERRGSCAFSEID